MDGTIHPMSSGDKDCFEDWQPFINDGICQEVSNQDACSFDGFDCCQDVINDMECWGDGCTCFVTGQIHAHVRRDFTNCTVEASILFNGNCDPEANVEECNWDMGDCCMSIKNGYMVAKDPTCSEGCICHETQTSHFGTLAI